MEYSPSSYLSLPSKPGVYRFFDEHDTILYVGKAKDLKSRVSSYFTGQTALGPKTQVLVSQIKKIEITIVESELEALLLEAFYIKKFTPKYNIRLTDGKMYPLIRITLKDTYPAVLFARKADDPRSVYFGPYPSSGAVKTVLKIIRRAFPFQSVPNHPKRVCLYHHLGLCVCPPMFDTPELQKTYRKYIRDIVRVLEGESRAILKELEKERDTYSKSEQYEQALEMQKKINALSLITSPVHNPLEYDINPNLREDIRYEELASLQSILQQHGYTLDYPARIECYDISNTQGRQATASMVVLHNGEVAKSQYRKFKIRKDGSPNDFAMMEEALTRRLKHGEWPLPQLLVVDGGKGQVSSALKAFAAVGISVPLIGLAKREETIITSNLEEISLPKDAKALQVIMRIRDEAHRFALTYHRKLRSKAALQ